MKWSRRVRGVVGYTVMGGTTGQRWIPPVGMYLVGVLLLLLAGGSALSNGLLTAALLLPVTAWMGISTLNADHPSQMNIMVASWGSARGFRSAVATIVWTVAVGLGIAGAAAAFLRGGSLPHAQDAPTAIVLLAAMIASSLTGVTLALCCARPLITHTGVSYLLAVSGCLLALGVHASPLHRLVWMNPAELQAWTFLRLLTIPVVGLILGCLLLGGVATRCADRRW